MIRTVIAAAILAGSATTADATTWNFTYVAGINTLSGQFDGTLQGDNNSIIVSSLSNLKLNNVAVPDLPFLNSVLALYSLSGPSSPAKLSLDGSGMDFAACLTQSCNQFGIAFFPGHPQLFTVPLYWTSPAYGNAFQPFDANNWSVTSLGGPVPEPASWAMLIAGFGLAGAAARRRRMARAA
ncbi:MAG: PEPxxWA-CTERM sorting domain-containing protein [Sphingomonadales bacterium]|jgi:hypothetical protein